MRLEFIRLNTEDKLVLHGLLREPENRTSSVLLHIHGMSGNFYENKFLDLMAEELINSGYAFFCINNRGHDIIADFPLVDSEEKYKRIGNAYERFEDCLLDIKPAIDLLTARGYTTIVLCGHSLGSVKVAYYMAKTQDPRIRNLILMSPPDMVGLAEKESYHEDLLKQAQQMVSEGKGEELLNQKIFDWYYLSANTYISLATRNGAVDIFNTYDKAEPSFLDEVRIPTLAFLGEKDDAAILPQQTALELIKQKAINAPLFDIDVIPGASHSYFGKEREMAERITTWLQSK